jgi:GNAT superfamily N-acetyltransferase
MPDLLVRLYDLPEGAEVFASLREVGIVCRRAESFERSELLRFVRLRWPRWADECEAAFARVPPTMMVATAGGDLAGFAAYHATRPNYFGPTAVRSDLRKRGIGTGLLLLALQAMREEGYAYAIIGGAGPTAFYERTVGAIVIPGSAGGIYKGKLPG